MSTPIYDVHPYCSAEKNKEQRSSLFMHLPSLPDLPERCPTGGKFRDEQSLFAKLLLSERYKEERDRWKTRQDERTGFSRSDLDADSYGSPETKIRWPKHCWVSSGWFSCIWNLGSMKTQMSGTHCWSQFTVSGVGKSMVQSHWRSGASRGDSNARLIQI